MPAAGPEIREASAVADNLDSKDFSPAAVAFLNNLNLIRCSSFGGPVGAASPWAARPSGTSREMEAGAMAAMGASGTVSFGAMVVWEGRPRAAAPRLVCPQLSHEPSIGGQPCGLTLLFQKALGLGEFPCQWRFDIKTRCLRS